MSKTAYIPVEDVLYPSNNLYDIPNLILKMQAGHLLLPIAPYGLGRKKRSAETIHFYVDDYRFSALWKNPAKFVYNKPVSAVEPNYSLTDTTPLAFGLQFIYQKRWLERFWQENGIQIYADLNVSQKFDEYNCMGIPDGYNAFATRGARGGIGLLKAKLAIAKRISGCDAPNLIVYGGGKAVHEFCCANSLLYIPDYMTERKNG